MYKASAELFIVVGAILWQTSAAFECNATSLNVKAAVQTPHHCIVKPINIKRNYADSIRYCKDSFPELDSRLVTGETLEKWLAIKQIIKLTPGIWHRMHMEQDSEEDLQGWRWIMPDNTQIFIKPRFFKTINIDSTLSFNALSLSGVIRWQNNQNQFSDTSMNTYNYLPICEIDLPNARQKSIDQMSRVEKLVHALTLECHNELTGIMIGSSCFYPSHEQLTHQGCVDFAEQTKVAGTQQHLAIIYTQEIANQIGLLLGTHMREFWIGLVNVIGGASHWNTNKIKEPTHGLRESDRPTLISEDLVTASECTTMAFAFTPKLKSKICDQSTRCLIERRVPAQRYELHKNQRYLSQDYNVLLNQSGVNNERHCALVCQQQWGCLAYNLNVAEEGGICELLPTKLSTAADNGFLTTALNWNYYERIG